MKRFWKTFKTEYTSDTVDVESDRGCGTVFLNADAGVDGHYASIHLSPKQARKLAKGLKKAATLAAK